MVRIRTMQKGDLYMNSKKKSFEKGELLWM